MAITATGGTITTDGEATIHTFTSSGTFTVTAGSGDVGVLIVGGGGAGGKIGPDANAGGGGGAGQVRIIDAQAVGVGSYTVVVGAGGISTLFVADATHDGGVSSFDGVTAIGGGGGAGVAAYPGGNTGRNGASGGGGCGSFAGGTGTAGFNGGSGIQTSPNYPGGGGGGAGAVGGNATGSVGGNGGTGVSNFITGAAVFYGGGGGGGTFSTGTAGTGGNGGGGAGRASTGNGFPGVANTGGGGGGGGCITATGGTGGTGGSGVVIVRYPPPPPPPNLISRFDTITASETAPQVEGATKPPLIISRFDTVTASNPVSAGLYSQFFNVISVGDTVTASSVGPVTILAPRDALLNGLLAYWKLNEASGTAIDVIGLNDLDDVNTVGSTAGKVGTARNFVPASSEYLTNPSTVGLGLGAVDFTFSVWAKITFTDLSDGPTIFSIEDSGGTADVSLSILAGQFYFFIRNFDVYGYYSYCGVLVSLRLLAQCGNRTDGDVH